MQLICYFMIHSASDIMLPGKLLELMKLAFQSILKCHQLGLYHTKLSSPKQEAPLAGLNMRRLQTCNVWRREKEGKHIKQMATSWARWLMPVIPELWDAKAGASRGQEFKTNLGNMLLRRVKEENRLNPGGCSEPRSCHCTPAWAGERDSISKKEKKNSTDMTKDASLCSRPCPRKPIYHNHEILIQGSLDATRRCKVCVH
ncbi:hypothetical protein AAY473_038310 [Plecturocebus cupreus]